VRIGNESSTIKTFTDIDSPLPDDLFQVWTCENKSRLAAAAPIYPRILTNFSVITSSVKGLTT